MLSEGCIIHADSITRSVIGIRARIGEKTVIENAIIMGADTYQTISELMDDDGAIPIGIGNNCLIENTIVDKGCCIGNDVIIKGGTHLPDQDVENYMVKDGIVVLRKGAVIPSGTKIGA